MSENYAVVADVSVANMQELDALINKIQGVGSAIGQVSTRTIKPSIDTSSMGGGLTSFLDSSKGNFTNVGRELGQSLQMGMQQQFGMMGGVASSLSGAFGPVGMAAVAATVAVTAVGSAATKAAMAWEDMKTSIGRTTGLGGENLEDMMNQLQGLRQEFGVTAQAASAMVEQAGSIGVGQKKMEAGDLKGYKQEILEFTKATAILQGAWGMSAEATSSGIGKMGSVTLNAWNMQRKARGEEEMSWADYAYKIGGQVDNLANSMGSSEEEIVTSMKQSSTAIAKWAPSEDTYGKWQAMASFLIDTGDSADHAGTRIERMSQKISENKTDVSALMGIDEATLSSSLKTDFMGTVQKLGESIASMPEGSRPDLNKLFGIEGAGLVEKVVADIEAGTGKLQGAFDLALKPGNVAKSYEDVADNASKQFARIGEAFQVSLEKIGGQLLPVVTVIASGIADAWIAANETGTSLFVAAQTALSSSDTRIKTAVQSGGGIIDIAEAMLGIGDEIAPTVSDAVLSGAATGAEAAAPGVASALTSDIAKKTAEEFAKANDEYIKSHSSGGYSKAMLEGETVKVKDRDPKSATYGQMIDFFTGGMAGQSAETKKLFSDSVKMKGINTFFGDYSLMSSSDNYRQGGGGIASIADAKGNIVKQMNFDYGDFEKTGKALEDSIKPIFLDMPKYLRSVKGDLSSTLEGILSDGVVAFEEKGQLDEMIKDLGDLKVKIGVSEFDKAGLDKKLQDLNDIKIGVKIDTGMADLSLAEWITKQSENFINIKANTGYIPQRSDEIKLQELYDQMSENDKRRYEAVTKQNASPTELASMPAILEQLLKNQPELASNKNFQANIQSMQKELNEHFQFVGGKLVAVGEKLEPLGDTAADVTTLLSGLGTGLVDLMSSVGMAKSAFQSASSMLSNSKYGGGALNWNGSSMFSSNVSQDWRMKAAKTNPLTDYFKGFGGGLLWEDIPKLATGGKVTTSGLAWIGEKGTEYVIPESEIKGLYPKSAMADKGSMQYLTNDQYYEDYRYKITPPTSYRWSQYPNAPNVQVSGNVPTAWLSDKQTTGMDAISGEIRELQLASIGKSQVQPWFARGEIPQPKWWSDAASKLSPQYAANWEATKGGTVPKIVPDMNIGSQSELSSPTGWAAVYDDQGTCIAFNRPDASLKFTPNVRKSVFDSGAWAAIYDDQGTCIGWNKPDPSLNFRPNAARGGLAGLDNGRPFGTVSKSISITGGAGNLVVGKSKEGYLASYDPRTDTCEGLSFVEPNPSLKTTDPFYLGLTKNSPFRSEDKEPGYGWSNRAWTDDPNLQQLMKIDEQAYQDQKKATEDAKKTAQNTSEMNTNMANLAQGTAAMGDLMVGGRGGGGWGGMNGMGSFFGNSWMSGGAPAVGLGNGASNTPSFMNEYLGYSFFANGGLVDSPEFFMANGQLSVRGEAGPELILPLNDRRRAAELLNIYLPDVRRFAQGGLVGGSSGSISARAGDYKINVNAPITTSGSKSELAEVVRALKNLPKEILKGIKAGKNARG